MRGSGRDRYWGGHRAAPQVERRASGSATAECAQRRSRRTHDGYRMAPGELPCESAVNPLRHALPRPACNAVTGLSDMPLPG
jgi:hypothetical protein